MKVNQKNLGISLLVPILMFGLFVLSSCQPYDDGPKISFRSKDKRLTFQNRRITYYAVDGQDSTDGLNQLLLDSLLNFPGTFSVYQEFEVIEGNLYYGEGDSRVLEQGSLVFDGDGKEAVNFFWDALPHPFPIKFTIKMLSKDQLWLGACRRSSPIPRFSSCQPL